MDTGFQRVRRWVLGAAVLVVLSVLGYQFALHNPERAELQNEIATLDVQLVQLKAISRAEDRYRAEVDQMSRRLVEGRRFFAGDLEVLSSSLARSGIALTAQRNEPDPSGRSGRATGSEPVRLSLQANDASSLSAAFSALQPRLCRLEHFRLDPGGAWKLEIRAHTFIPPPPASRAPAPSPRWYSALNQDLRHLIASKQAELDALRAELGELKDFLLKKRELDELSRTIQGLAATRDGHAELILALFLDEPILSSGTVTPDQAGLKVQGRLGPRVDPASVPSRLAPRWKVVSIAVAEGQLDLVVARVADKNRDP